MQGESEVQGHPLLYSKFEAILGYLRPCVEGIEASSYSGLRGELLLFHALEFSLYWWAPCYTIESRAELHLLHLQGGACD